MVLDMAKPKNKFSTIWPGMRGRDAARKLNLKLDILQVLTIDSSEIQLEQPAIGWTEQECKEWDELAKEDHPYRLTPEEKKSVTEITGKHKRSQGVINDLPNVDFVPSNVNSSHHEALLYVFEDNEAVIKMILKGRSPNKETCFQNPQSCS